MIKQILNETDDGFVKLVKTPISSSWLFGTKYKYSYELKDGSNNLLKTQPISQELYERCRSVPSKEFVFNKTKYHIIKSITIECPAKQLKRCILRLNDLYIDVFDSHVLHELNLLNQTTFIIPFLDGASIPNLILQLQEVVLRLEFYEHIDYDQIKVHIDSCSYDQNFVYEMFMPQIGGPFLYNMNQSFDITIPNKYYCCEPQVCDTLEHVFRLNIDNIHTIHIACQNMTTHEFIEDGITVGKDGIIEHIVVLDEEQKIVYYSDEPKKIELNRDNLIVSIKCKQVNLNVQICVFAIHKTVLRCSGGQLGQLNFRV